jgi:polyisoprenoid-binding protein YceI
MGPHERKALEPLLEAEAAKRADDKEFAATLAFYAKAEPGERVNELHSIIGTEFDTVSTELEGHYAIYFTDRAALISMHQKSNQVFVEQAAQIDALVTQLDALAAAINADYATYNAGYDRLNADIGSFNTRADNGSFTSEAQFNAERSSLMRRQANLDALYASIDTRSTQYDALLAQLDALNAAADDLARSINIEPRQTDGL